ncbi:hypothetical protein AB833_18250 [Chromatiales bacterium (ex Bugula neritina AB1)]|nr:hypothetical protein AB833_18250 [Chromatiales bacterium (ex Bugula neritina AB1)]
MAEYSHQYLSSFAGLLLACSTILWPATGLSHEYWLDPVQYHIAANDQLSVNIRNGQNFKGTALIYDAGKFERHYVIDSNGKTNIKSRIGDYPALQHNVTHPGLSLVLLDTRENTLVYPTLERFHAFLEYHALESIKEQHAQRGFPIEGIRENYFRFTKALIEVEQSSQNPNPQLLQPQQQALEIVALENPYRAGDKLNIQILHNSQPLGNRQVETFRQALDTKRSITTTDDNGYAEIDISEAGKYLLNVVYVVDSTQEESHWKSLWASMTFLIKNSDN